MTKQKFTAKFEELQDALIEGIDTLNEKLLTKPSTEVEIIATQRATFVLNASQMYINDDISEEMMYDILSDSQNFYSRAPEILERSQPDDFEKIEPKMFDTFDSILSDLLEELPHTEDPFADLLRALGV